MSSSLTRPHGVSFREIPADTGQMSAAALDLTMAEALAQATASEGSLVGTMEGSVVGGDDGNVDGALMDTMKELPSGGMTATQMEEEMVAVLAFRLAELLEAQSAAC